MDCVSSEGKIIIEQSAMARLTDVIIVADAEQQSADADADTDADADADASVGPAVAVQQVLNSPSQFPGFEILLSTKPSQTFPTLC